MEQKWTVDRYDAPSGDVEFWALRTGRFPQSADHSPATRRKRLLIRAGVAVLMAVAAGAVL